MAAVRTLQMTTLPVWASKDNSSARTMSFVFTHDRSMDVILQNQRGEGFVKQVFRLLLAGGQGCSSSTPGIPNATVLDIGSNTGYYSMASAAHGCLILAFDAQPGCRQWFEWARSANHDNATRAGGVSFYRRDRVRIITRPVSFNAAPVEIDRYACWVMHKIDVRLRRRRRRAASGTPSTRTEESAGSVAASTPARRHRQSTANGSEVELVTQSGRKVLEGRVAVRPVGSRELSMLLPADSRVLVAKIDTEGAELNVLKALEPMLPRISNLLVEVAPGWWSLYTNKTRSGRGGEGRGRTSDRTSHAPRVAEVASEMQLRANGAHQLSQLLLSRDKGGFGFQAALTSNSRLFSTPEHIYDFILHMGGNGYWNQADIWFSRDLAAVRAARYEICLRQQAEERARDACGDGTPSPSGKEHLSPKPRSRRAGGNGRRGWRGLHARPGS